MSIKYRLIADNLIDYIKNDKHFSGKLPSENELCRQYNVSRQTIRQALKLLEEKHIIEKHQGSGSFFTGLEDGNDNRIVLIYIDDTDYNFPMYSSHMSTTLNSEGFNVEILISHNSYLKEKEILQNLINNPPKGLISYPVKSAFPNPNDKLYAKLEKAGCKVVLADYINSSYSFTYVKEKNISAVNTLVEHLVTSGHKTIGSLFLYDTLSGSERFQGFNQSIVKYNLADCENLISWFSRDQLNILRTNQNIGFLRNYLISLPQECTAILVYNDEIAYWLCRAMHSLGIDVNRYEIVSFDNSPQAHFGEKRFYSIGHPGALIPDTIAELLIKKIKGLPVNSLEVPYEIPKY